MANLPTKILRLLVKRGHALLGCEIDKAFPGTKEPHAVSRALLALRSTGCIAWTTQGWLATDTGRRYVAVNIRLLFDRSQRRASA